MVIDWLPVLDYLYDCALYDGVQCCPFHSLLLAFSYLTTCVKVPKAWVVMCKDFKEFLVISWHEHGV